MTMSLALGRSARESLRRRDRHDAVRRPGHDRRRHLDPPEVRLELRRLGQKGTLLDKEALARAADRRTGIGPDRRLQGGQDRHLLRHPGSRVALGVVGGGDEAAAQGGHPDAQDGAAEDRQRQQAVETRTMPRRHRPSRRARERRPARGASGRAREPRLRRASARPRSAGFAHRRLGETPPVRPRWRPGPRRDGYQIPTRAGSEPTLCGLCSKASPGPPSHLRRLVDRARGPRRAPRPSRSVPVDRRRQLTCPPLSTARRRRQARSGLCRLESAPPAVARPTR